MSTAIRDERNTARQATAAAITWMQRVRTYADSVDRSWSVERTLVLTLADGLLAAVPIRSARLRALVWHRNLWRARARYRRQSAEAQRQAANYAGQWAGGATCDAMELVDVRIALRRT